MYLGTFGFFDGVEWEWAGIGFCLAFALVWGPLFSTLALRHGRCVEPIGSQRVVDVDGPALLRAQSHASACDAAAASAGDAPSYTAAATREPAAAASLQPPTSSPSAVNPTSLLGQSVRTRAVLARGASSSLAEGGLHFAPATLSFRDVSYTVTLKDGSSKTLLRGVSGVVRPGRLHALMGAR